MSRVTSRQSSTCSTIAQGGPRLLGVHTRGASQRSVSGSVNSTPCLSRDNSRNSAGSGPQVGTQQNNMHVQTSFDSGFSVHSYLGKDSKRETVMNEVYKKGLSGNATSQPTPLVTVINADSEQVGAKGTTSGSGTYLCTRPIISGAPSPRQLSRQGSSIESSTVHTHTVECAGSARLHQPVTSHSRGSPTSNECDFHCCSLHAGHVNNHSSHKNATTSPVQVTTEDDDDDIERVNRIQLIFSAAVFQAEEGKRTLPKGAHVRFDVESLGAGVTANSKCNFATETAFYRSDLHFKSHF